MRSNAWFRSLPSLCSHELTDVDESRVRKGSDCTCRTTAHGRRGCDGDGHDLSACSLPCSPIHDQPRECGRKVVVIGHGVRHHLGSSSAIYTVRRSVLSNCANTGVAALVQPSCFWLVTAVSQLTCLPFQPTRNSPPNHFRDGSRTPSDPCNLQLPNP